LFEIGNSLREARLRHDLDFPQIEQATKIRGKYLRALEEEQFEVLPAETYVKGFLRSYAEYLGLDGQLYVDEYNSRYIHVDEETPLRTRSSSSLGRAAPRFAASVVLLALAGIAVLTLLVFAAWRYGSSTPETAILDYSTQPPATTGSTAPRARTARPRRARMTITGARGESWVEVYAGSRSGKLIFEGTVLAGGTVRFGQERVYRRYFVRMRAPGNLRMTINGRLVSLPNRRALTVTANGIRPAAT
jgi:cytoskeleton protein RodZ